MRHRDTTVANSVPVWRGSRDQTWAQSSGSIPQNNLRGKKMEVEGGPPLLGHSFEFRLVRRADENKGEL